MEEEKSSRRIGDKKTKKLLTQKNNDKKWGKKKREWSIRTLNTKDQAAAPYHYSTPSSANSFGIILYILIFVL